MRISAVAVLMILTTVFLSGCGTSHEASLEDRSHNYYGRNGTYSGAARYADKNTYQDAAVVSVSAADLPAPTAGAALNAPAPDWQWPVQGKVTQNFGPQGNGVANEGIVIAAAAGTPIHAAKAGEVAFVGSNVPNYGNMVILRHANGDMSSYSYARNIIVTKGQHVAAGAVLGYVGQSGGVASPQLHFALREGTHAVNPLSKLPQQVASR